MQIAPPGFEHLLPSPFPMMISYAWHTSNLRDALCYHYSLVRLSGITHESINFIPT